MGATMASRSLTFGLTMAAMASTIVPTATSNLDEESTEWRDELVQHAHSASAHSSNAQPLDVVWASPGAHASNMHGIRTQSAAVGNDKAPVNSWEAIMANLHTIDSPWARRLVAIDGSRDVSASGLLTIVNILRTSDRERWPAPGIFQGEDGGVRLEWHDGPDHTTFEIDPDGDMYAYFFNFERAEEAESEPRVADEAVDFIREHVNA